MNNVVTICGSMKFYDKMQTVARYLTLDNWVVLMPFAIKDTVTVEKARMLDRLHRQKIDMCNRVVIVTVDNYIGESTTAEIAYAESLCLPIVYVRYA